MSCEGWYFCNADDDTLTAQTSTSSQHQHQEAGVQAQQAHQAGPDQSSVLLHRQAWDESMLPKPLSWKKGNESHPEVALNQAKQDFAQWLLGVHAHPYYVEHMQHLAAASQAAAWPNTGYQSGASIHLKTKNCSSRQQLIRKLLIQMPAIKIYLTHIMLLHSRSTQQANLALH